MKYSIIMPVYNSQNSLQKSINSILNQTYPNWELIAIDDGSTDDSLLILKEISKNDDRIKVFHQKNSGPGKARNYGISKATGDYLCFIDSDDYYEDNYLSIINNKINHSKSDLIYISMINEYKNGKIINVIDTTRYKNESKENLLKLQLSGIVPWGPCSKVVKKEIIKNCKFQELDVGEELIYSFQILQNADKIDFENNGLYHYVHNDNGQHKKGGYDPWGPLVKNVKKFLEDNDIYTEYEKSMNSLAIKALTISIYRYCISYNYNKALGYIKKNIKTYKKCYNLNNYDKKCLDILSKIIMLCLNLKIYYLIYIISNFRNKKRK